MQKNGTHLVDASFVPRDPLYCRAQYRNVIDTQGGDASDHRLGHNICTVVCASDTDFKNGSIDLGGRSTNARGRNVIVTDIQRQECMKRDERHHAKVPRSKWGGFGSSLDGLGESARRKKGMLWIHTPWFFSSLSHTSKKNEENRSSDRGTEFIRIRSRTAMR